MYVRRFKYHLRARPFNVCEFEFCPNVKGFDIMVVFWAESLLKMKYKVLNCWNPLVKFL